MAKAEEMLKTSHLTEPWVDEAVSPPIQPIRPGRPSSRVLGALRRASENVCQIACDRVLGRIRLPPDGVFQTRSFSDASRNTYELMRQTAEDGLCSYRINPHQCPRTSSDIHTAGAREVRVFRGFDVG